tara:strand:- start:5888 stop:7525 length:1638 start_codon:yes stop_codon:yes gene_type:complete
MAEELPELDEAQNENILDNAPQAPGSLLSSNRLLIIIGIVGVVAIIAAGIFFSRNSSQRDGINNPSVMQGSTRRKPAEKKKKRIKYERLYSQLESGDASKILKELSIANINFTTEQTGRNFSVLIDEDQLEDARNLLALKGLPSGTMKQGYELLDDAQTLGVTEFDKRIRFLRALSGELEKAINQIDIIESCKVQIVQPEQRLFAVTQPPVTSSILVRIIKGSEINDDIVYSIIQLVANSVENLQPENVSVVDTDGNLLSDDIFTRIAARRAGTFVEEETVEEVIDPSISREEAIGYPIIPNYNQIQEWFDIKYENEQKLAEEAEKQLIGVLPIASFKVAVSTEIGPLEDGQVVDIKRQTVSVVVDGLNEDIDLNAQTKQNIFSTVASAVGYLSGRDSIQLSVAEYALFSPEEREALIQKYRKRGPLYYSMMTILGGLLIVSGFFLFRVGYTQYQKIQEARRLSQARDIDATADAGTFQLYDNDRQIEEFKLLSQSSPEIIAKTMNSFIEEDLEDEDLDDEIDDDAEEPVEIEEATDEELVENGV